MNLLQPTSGNDPLRGGKGQLYEGGIRIPFFAKWPAHISSGKIFSAPVRSMDIAATALAAANVKDRAGLDGVDLLPHWREETKSPPHAELYWRYGHQFALRSGQWKWVQAQKPGTTPQLFDLESDPGESNDLTATDPQRVAELKAKWDRLNSEMVSPIR